VSRLPWWRFWDEALDDPKIQRLPPELFRAWVNLLCLANRGTPRGRLPPLPNVAFALRTTEAEASWVLEELAGRGLVEREGGTYVPHNWDGRQFASDSSTERVRRFRQKTQPGDAPRETARNVSCNVSGNDGGNVRDTETESDPETEQSRTNGGAAAPRKRSPDPPGFVEYFWGPGPWSRDRKPAVDAWRRLDPDPALMREIKAAIERQKRGRLWQQGMVKAPHRWLRDRNWEDEVEPWRPAAPAAANGTRPPPSASEVDWDDAEAVMAGWKGAKRA